MSFHALTNLGILGQNGDDAIRRNAEKRHWHIHCGRSGSVSLSKDLGHGTGVTCNKNPATGYGCQSKKATTVEKCGLHEYLAMRREFILAQRLWLLTSGPGSRFKQSRGEPFFGRSSGNWSCLI